MWKMKLEVVKQQTVFTAFMASILQPRNIKIYIFDILLTSLQG